MRGDMFSKKRRARVLAGGALLALGLAGLTGCDNTQGTTPQTNIAETTHRPIDDNQNNGAGSGTVEKPASSGGGSWTDPNPVKGGTRNPYGTGKTISGRNGSS